ncbi:MAG: ATP-binding protein, partial [Chloroflexi bacterium]|nr:ATP-binding protein [Chloroflexota bacterium]
MKISLHEIRSDYIGFLQLVKLAAQTESLSFGSLAVDMSAVTWIDANMCAPFGALLYRIGRDLNSVSLVSIPDAVEKILSKNAFLSNYGRARRLDTYGTTIEYKRFEPKDDRYFAVYVEKYLRRLAGKGFPRMSVGLRKKFQESILEIFGNAVTHSETKLGIFACGQYFPNKRRLDFSIADLGVGMRRNLKKKRGIVLSAE